MRLYTNIGMLPKLCAVIKASRDLLIAQRQACPLLTKSRRRNHVHSGHKTTGFTFAIPTNVTVTFIIQYTV